MAPKPHIVCVIPARYGAQRFPGKPLVHLSGKPMIQWVYEAAQQVPLLDEVFVATDDERICAAVEGFGGKVIMTSPELPSGSDRIAAAMVGRKGDILVNVQGDEPGMHPETIRVAVQGILDNPRADVSTACIPITDEAVFNNPYCVKVVRSQSDVALYFSRSPMPSRARVDGPTPPGTIIGYKHLGVYVYRREALEAYVKLPQTPLELVEKLEQLRFLEVGAQIVCKETPYDSIGVDAPANVPEAEALLALRRAGK
ncbi:MAG: 3-deoxy-manno-octulosonate cytidylyltransferase [Candidatus Sumerlaeia bacterium]|nr:3-deoxy-manno-octulosonate cytidylyltransferase [Candidatus Sumerlaeia bacterium]